MKKLKIVTIYESKLYREDTDFKNDDEKDAYYEGDFWQDSDYILIKGQSIPAVCVDDEIIYDDGWLDALLDRLEFTSNEDKKIIAFYTDELLNEKKASGEFEELSTWPIDIEESNNTINKAPLAIKYRGGQGYHYGWWLLN